jgi:hypothetical protein
MGSVLISELQFRLSGGAANADPNLSLGGALSSFQVSDTIINSLFDDIILAEALAGHTDYRCIYIHNTSTTSSFRGGVIWMSLLPGGDATMTIGLGSGGYNSVPTVIANENTAPSGVTFNSAISEATSLYVGNIGPLGKYPIWIKRVQAVNASPPSQNASFTLLLKGQLNT